MKLYITKEKNDVNGYKNVIIEGNKLEIGDVFENSCEEIILDKVLEHIDNAKNVLVNLTRLLRKNGTIKIYGIDLRNMCLNYIDSTISSEEISNVIKNTRNIFSISDIVHYVRLNNLKVDILQLNGHIYELVCVRK